MSKKAVLSFETEYGTFTRQTDRPYAFVVASRGKTAAAYRADRVATLTHLGQKLAGYRQVVATGVVPAGYSLLTVDHYVEFVASTEAQIAKLVGTPDDADELAAEVTMWGFSATRANAEKTAQKARSFGYQGVRVFSQEAN